MTITPYGRDIEPNVPSKRDILSAFQYLSHQIGANRIVWRYDPILINHTYTTAYHIEAFRSMAETLQGYTHQVVISFIDLYEKQSATFQKPVPSAPMTRCSSSMPFRKLPKDRARHPSVL